MVEKSPDIKSILADFMEFVGEDVIVCHNAGFNLNFLNRVATELFGKIIGNDYIDVLCVSKERLPKLRTHALSALVD